MKTRQWLWTQSTGWQGLGPMESPPTLVLIFGARPVLEHGDALSTLTQHVPKECCFGCNTAGEIENANVRDDTVVATGLWLERASFVSSVISLADAPNDEERGRLLADRLPRAGLVHALVLSDGTQVNGSDLARGLTMGLPKGVGLSGGLSGDGDAMKHTVVIHAGQVRTNCISLLGFCGPIRIGTGSLGGWDSFGPTRAVTKAHGNVLEELDGEPALALYKRYLGRHAAELPASALLFPLLVTFKEGDAPVVRTVLGVDDEKGTMTFAGDVPQGSTAQLMRANFERIIEAGEGAAATSVRGGAAEFALLISCVGRKLILKQRVEEEVEAVRNVLGESVLTTGFYSYGELAPQTPDAPCQLHNQTMTITTFTEV